MDYADFAEAYGGGYGARLTLVELPACALTTPDKAKCRTATPVATDNDTEKQTLTARSVSLSAGTPTVLAAVAGDDAKSGDYKATPLSPSAAWSTDLNTGDFGWSYDIPVPEVPGEMAPEAGPVVLLGQRSTAAPATPTTSPPGSATASSCRPVSSSAATSRARTTGRRPTDGVNKPGDLCWGYDNAYITFNGKGGELVPTGKDDEFKLQQDDGTRIARLKSTDRGNGDNDGEYWRVTDPQGNRYYFGYNRLPGWADGKETTDSTWTVPVLRRRRRRAVPRLHVRRLVVPAGMAVEPRLRRRHPRQRDRVLLRPRRQLLRPQPQGDRRHPLHPRRLPRPRRVRPEVVARCTRTKALAKVDFASSERCIPNASTDCSSISKDSFYWYDTPWDLNCDEASDCDNGRLAPSFWTRKRLTGITTQVLKDGAYSKVDSWKLAHRWGQADVDYQLLLDSIQRTGHTATPAITLPKTTFAYTQLANRLDKTGDGYAPFIKARLSTIADEFGGQTDVNYSAPACNAASLPTPQTNTTRCFPQMLGGSDTDDPERHWFNKYVATSVTATDRTGGAPDPVTAYEYLGDAAWHYDDDDGLTKEKYKTWSQWRGYGHVRVKTGGQGGDEAMKSQQTPTSCAAWTATARTPRRHQVRQRHPRRGRRRPDHRPRRRRPDSPTRPSSTPVPAARS